MAISDSSNKVSIIMPTFNRAKLIMHSIESIRQQTHTNWELIVVDDGSADNTAALVKSIADTRIHFFQAGRTGNIGHVKNIGLKQATGNFIAFLDSDDLWDERKLELQLEAFSSFPGAGFSLAGGYNFIREGEPSDFFYKQREGIKYGNVFLSFFQSALPAYTQALLLKKDCLATCAVFDEKRSYADIVFMLELASNYPAIIIYEPLVFRRLHEGSISKASWIQYYNDGVDVLQLYRSQIPGNIYRKALSGLYVNWGEDLLKRKQPGPALVKFMKAFFNEPFHIVPIKKMVKAILIGLHWRN